MFASVEGGGSEETKVCACVFVCMRWRRDSKASSSCLWAFNCWAARWRDTYRYTTHQTRRLSSKGQYWKYKISKLSTHSKTWQLRFSLSSVETPHKPIKRSLKTKTRQINVHFICSLFHIRRFKLWFIRLSGEYTFFFANQSHTLSSLLNSAKTILRKCIFMQEGATEAVRISFAVNMMCLSRSGIEQITCCNNWMSCSWYVAWHDNSLRLSYCIWLKPVQKTYLFLFQVLLRGASTAQKMRRRHKRGGILKSITACTVTIHYQACMSKQQLKMKQWSLFSKGQWMTCWNRNTAF